MTPHLLQPLLDLLKSRSHKAAPPVCRQPLAHPVRDWALLMLGAATLLMLSAAAAAGLYLWEVSADETGSSTLQTAGFNVQKLEDTLAHYRAIDAERARLLSAPPSATDPAK